MWKGNTQRLLFRHLQEEKLKYKRIGSLEIFIDEGDFKEEYYNKIGDVIGEDKSIEERMVFKNSLIYRKT